MALRSISPLAQRTVSRPRRKSLGIGLLLVLLVAPAQAQTTTQRIELAEGKNLVSLSMRPVQPRMDSIFAPVLEDILAVWGEDEARFAPGVSSDLAEWDWQTSYVVYTRRAVGFDVIGEPIDPEAEIALKAGLNSVPYPRTIPMRVEDAFASIAGVLEYAEDAAGRRYPAETGREALHQLVPGQGYRLRLSSNTSLTYPSGDSGGGEFEGDITVNTMAEALALEGLQPGTTVGVAGYYRANDGGGGVFEVRESGAATDGGLVFVPNEHVSSEVSETYEFLYGDYAFQAVPADQSVVFGTLRLVLNNASGSDPLPVDGVYLHGHRHASDRALHALMDYGENQFEDRGALYAYFRDSYGDRRNGRIQFTYKHTTSPIRLHRTNVGFTLNTHWFGVRPASEGPMWTGGTDVQPLINHVINVASSINKSGSGRITDVLLPALDTYDYFGSIELSEGLTIRGAAGTELATVTNDLGHTYQPVRIRASHTRLRVMDGEALKHIRMLRSPSDPVYLKPDVKMIMQGRPTSISPEHESMAMGIADIVLDGNWENNRDAWDDGWATHKELEDWCRNSPGYAAFVSSRQGGKRIPQGQLATVRNVAILGYASNGLLGDANTMWDVENLRAGDSAWNHVIYNANGDYVNVTLVGYAWGHAAWGSGTIENLVYEDGALSPVRQGKEVFAIRGGDAYDPDELAGDDGYFTREDGTVDPNLGTTITGFYFDLRDSGLSAAFNGIGRNIVIRGRSPQEPGRIITGAGGLGVFYESANGSQDALFPGNRFEHIRVFDVGDGERGQTFGEINFTNSVIRDVQSEGLQASGATSARSLVLRANWRDHPAWETPQTIEIESLVEKTPHFFIARVGVHEAAKGLNVEIRNSSFANTTNTLFQGPNGTGRVSGFVGDVSKLRVSMEDTEFNLHENSFENTELFFAMTQFLRVTDRRSGRTSEDGGQYVWTATGGETTIDIPTNLFWKPLDPSYITVSSATDGLVQSVEAVHANSRPEDWRGPSLRVSLSRTLQAGENVTFNWTAAVNPIGESAPVVGSGPTLQSNLMMRTYGMGGGPKHRGLVPFGDRVLVVSAPNDDKTPQKIVAVGADGTAEYLRSDNTFSPLPASGTSPSTPKILLGEGIEADYADGLLALLNSDSLSDWTDSGFLDWGEGQRPSGIPVESSTTVPLIWRESHQRTVAVLGPDDPSGSAIIIGHVSRLFRGPTNPEPVYFPSAKVSTDRGRTWDWAPSIDGQTPPASAYAAAWPNAPGGGAILYFVITLPGDNETPPLVLFRPDASAEVGVSMETPYASRMDLWGDYEYTSFDRSFVPSPIRHWVTRWGLMLDTGTEGLFWMDSPTALPQQVESANPNYGAPNQTVYFSHANELMRVTGSGAVERLASPNSATWVRVGQIERPEGVAWSQAASSDTGALWLLGMASGDAAVATWPAGVAF